MGFGVWDMAVCWFWSLDFVSCGEVGSWVICKWVGTSCVSTLVLGIECLKRQLGWRWSQNFTSFCAIMDAVVDVYGMKLPAVQCLSSLYGTRDELQGRGQSIGDMKSMRTWPQYNAACTFCDGPLSWRLALPQSHPFLACRKVALQQANPGSL